jgi:glycosyltransferase involved in cell wall biosynthesis
VSLTTREMAATAIGVCLPIHNEEQTLPRALAALQEAIHRAEASAISCTLVAVLDDCSDRSEDLVRQWAFAATIPTLVIECSARNVGCARQTGFLALIEACNQVDRSRLWLATTDADSEVPSDWLTHQIDCLNRDVEFWAGRVEVLDWTGRASATSRLWNDAYRSEWAPIHGANLGISADLFLRVGGFPPLICGEDDALRHAVIRSGASVYHDWRAPVKTSSRSVARAPAGFAHYLNCME